MYDITPNLTIEYHHSMLTDEVRTQSFLRAVLKTVKPGDVVLDLGCGTGILSYFACMSGAKRVYAVEQGPVIELAKAICWQNGYQNKVLFLNDWSTNIELPEPVDVIVTGCGFSSTMWSLSMSSAAAGAVRCPKRCWEPISKGVVISDIFSAYSPLEAEKAKCWSHLLRDSHALTKGQPPPEAEQVQFHQQLHHLFLEMGLALEQVAADETKRKQVYQEMRDKLVALAQQEWQAPDCQRLVARIPKHREELLLWLRHPAVEPDNNKAERGLRPAVVTRKTSFGSRSKQGAHAFARLLSLIQTWEGQGLDFFDMAQSTLTNTTSQN